MKPMKPAQASVTRKRGLAGSRFDFLAEAIHKNPQIFQFIAVVRAPYGLQQFPVSDGLIRPGDKIGQQIEFLGREASRAAAHADLPRRKVDFYPLQFELL